MKKTILIALLFIAICATNAEAQSFNNAIGLRLGYPVSVTYKHFLSEPSAVEVFAGTRSYGYGYSVFNNASRYRYWVVGGAYQYHKPIPITDGLEYYFGGGASVYFWNYGEYFSQQYASTTFGIQGYIGLNYTFDNIPLNVFVDWVPTIFINSYVSGFGGGHGAVGARYVISR